MAAEAFCPACKESLKKATSHCPSQPCGWVRCATKSCGAVVVPANGRYYLTPPTQAPPTQAKR